jgi:putative endonuclease
MPKSKSKFHIYILLCNDNSFYTGYTNDIEKRIDQHNGIILGGGKYTRSKRPVELVYKESFDSKSEAMKREFEIKKMSHEEKSRLINDN